MPQMAQQAARQFIQLHKPTKILATANKRLETDGAVTGITRLFIKYYKFKICNPKWQLV